MDDEITESSSWPSKFCIALNPTHTTQERKKKVFGDTSYSVIVQLKLIVN